jgi:hypothetical protein
MKKISVILVIALLLILPSCSATTITEHEGNYVYSKNEDINIIDIDTRDNIGTLKMNGIEVLKNKSFTIKEKNGSDESGNDIYEDVTYEQLMQIYYRYDNKGSKKTISSANFNVYDQTRTSCKIDPDIEYDAIKRSGEEYFVVALKNKGEFIDMNFKYNITQTTNTAKIKLKISEKSDATSSNNSSSVNDTSNQNKPETNNVNPFVLYAIIVF